MHDAEAAAAQVNCRHAADCDWGVAGGVRRSRLRQRGIKAIKAESEAGATLKVGVHVGGVA